MQVGDKVKIIYLQNQDLEETNLQVGDIGTVDRAIGLYSHKVVFGKNISKEPDKEVFSDIFFDYQIEVIK
jgi:hypothetical protein